MKTWRAPSSYYRSFLIRFSDGLAVCIAANSYGDAADIGRVKARQIGETLAMVREVNPHPERLAGKDMTDGTHINQGMPQAPSEMRTMRKVRETAPGKPQVRRLALAQKMLAAIPRRTLMGRSVIDQLSMRRA